MDIGREEEFLKAVELGEYEQVKELVEAGVDINYSNGNNTTALHFAAWNGYGVIAAYLIKNGINVRAVEGQNWAAIHDAVRKENSDMVLTILTTAFGLKNIVEYKKKFYSISNNRDKHFLELLRLIKEHSFSLYAIGICGNGLLDDAKNRGYRESLLGE